VKCEVLSVKAKLRASKEAFSQFPEKVMKRNFFFQFTSIFF